MVTKEEIQTLWTELFKGAVEFGNEGTVCYRQTSWNKEDEEWNIEHLPEVSSPEFVGVVLANIPDGVEISFRRRYKLWVVCVVDHKGKDSTLAEALVKALLQWYKAVPNNTNHPIKSV